MRGLSRSVPFVQREQKSGEDEQVLCPLLRTHRGNERNRRAAPSTTRRSTVGHPSGGSTLDGRIGHRQPLFLHLNDHRRCTRLLNAVQIAHRECYGILL